MIIGTLSVVCTLKGSDGSRISPREEAPTPQGGCQHTILPYFPKNCMEIERIWGPQGGAHPHTPLDPPTEGYVEIVDRKDQSNAIVVLCMLCCLLTLSIQKIKARKCIQCYLCQHCRYKTHPHISAHNFLNIQPIFNPQKVLES